VVRTAEMQASMLPPGVDDAEDTRTHHYTIRMLKILAALSSLLVSIHLDPTGNSTCASPFSA
jgi:hypothetical protein